LTNVFAVLKGATHSNRVYFVSGHYDSMCTSPPDAKCDARGKMTMLRAQRFRWSWPGFCPRFDATLVFLTVHDEEQGLPGAEYYAEQAKLSKMNIEAMFTNDIVGGAASHRNSPNRNKVGVFSERVSPGETEQEAGTPQSRR
jgi:hypothetical protein